MCVRELGPDKYLSKPQKCDDERIRKYREIISETKRSEQDPKSYMELCTERNGERNGDTKIRSLDEGETL